MNSKYIGNLWISFWIASMFSIFTILLVLVATLNPGCSRYILLSERLSDYMGRLIIKLSTGPLTCAATDFFRYPDIFLGFSIIFSLLSLFVIKKNSYFKSFTKKDLVLSLFLGFLLSIVIGIIFYKKFIFFLPI